MTALRLRQFTRSIANRSWMTLKVHTASISCHGFASVADAENYLKSDLFTQDVVVELKPYFLSEPDVRIYSVVG